MVIRNVRLEVGLDRGQESGLRSERSASLTAGYSTCKGVN
jgi:hypothetical protein